MDCGAGFAGGGGGRVDLSEVTIQYAPAYIGDDIAHQREELCGLAGMVRNYVVDLVNRYGLDERQGPGRALSDIKERQEYDYRLTTAGRATRAPTSFPTTSSTGSAYSAQSAATSNGSRSYAVPRLNTSPST